MKYLLSVEVKLQELPDEEPLPAIRPGDDPLAAMAGMFAPAVKSMVGGAMAPFQFGSKAGFDFRKSTPITVRDFAALAGVVGKFDNLVQDIAVGALSVQE